MSILVYIFITYFIVRLLYYAFPKQFSTIIMLCVVIICMRELYLTFFHMKGNRFFNHSFYAICGSFNNPGPFGGFLAIIISLLIPFCYRKKKFLRNKYSVRQLNKSLFVYRNEINKGCLFRTMLAKFLVWRMFYMVVFVSLLLSIILLPSTQSRSALLSLLVSMSLFAFGSHEIKAFLKPIFKKYSLFFLIVTVIVGVCAYQFKKSSADGRLLMEKICLKAICSEGWKGVGFEHFGEAYGKAQAVYFKNLIDKNDKDDLEWDAINKRERMVAGTPEHAFNEYLFIGLVAGPIALLIFVSIIITSIIISFRRGTIWCYGLTAFAVFALFSYPLHVKQLLLLLPILVGACLSDSLLACNENKDLVRIVALIFSLIIFSIVAVEHYSEYRNHKQAEAKWNNTEYWYNMEMYDYVVKEGAILLPYLRNNYHFLFAYGHSLNKTGQYEKSDSILRLGTEISSDPMFWNVMGNNSLALGRYREAEERYKHAFYMVPNRLYPLTLLAKLYHAEGDTARFLDMADKVKTFVPKIENANTARLRAEIREIREGYVIEAIRDDEKQ